MKRLVFTLHAEVKLRERELQRSWIEETVRGPEWTEPEPTDASAERRFRAIEEAGGRVLRVVCVETSTTIRVVTATLDRGARKRR